MVSRRVLLAAPFVATAARAQSWPARPVRIVIPFPPGGGIDILVRAAAQDLSAHWRQPVVVENRAGAGGVIGTEAVARATPDGYTLLGTTNQTITSGRFLYKQLPYDPDRDLAPVSLMVSSDQLVLAHPSVPANTLAELVALARREPGKLTYGSFGIGTQPQLLFETLNSRAGLDLLHVPYNGISPLLLALTAGEVMLTTGSAAVAGELLRGGRAKALAVTGTQRVAQFQHVATAAEQGFGYLRATIWYALFAPAGTPDDIIRKVAADLTAVLRAPNFAERQVRAKALDLVASDGAALARVIREEVPLMQTMIQTARIEPQ
ncbi:MAG TPA: tripartite tricarboxylate transporter substrate-binding protein [Crenalkalicoccus sp.]|jgi:tripartite-type tricarboxylate transporter receptor subunit TctC|nr:tripartite tricarboxylate transporter substrate-binding protein [Crenalkalicoccus sp.]